MKKKIVSIVGARPQFIKCGPLSRELRKYYDEILVHTGQHYNYEMSNIFFDELDIPKPDYNLGVGSCSHGEQTGRILVEIEKVLVKEKPELILVYGDTNSTLSGALAASKLQIRVVHVESGLRSFDRSMPEEINRVITDHISNLLLCPTKTAVDNLMREGITEGVHLVGDVMVDAIEYNNNVAEEKSKIISRLGIEKGRYLVITLHRPSNTDSKGNMTSIISALRELNKVIIFPMHPRTENCICEYGLLLPQNVKLIKPVGYLDMLMLISNAEKILTDSGGIQKEAYLLGVPCITLRENTEWVETLENGWNVLSGANKTNILEAVDRVFPTDHKEIFGKSGTSKRIISILRDIV